MRKVVIGVAIAAVVIVAAVILVLPKLLTPASPPKPSGGTRTVSYSPAPAVNTSKTPTISFTSFVGGFEASNIDTKALNAKLTEYGFWKDKAVTVFNFEGKKVSQTTANNLAFFVNNSSGNFTYPFAAGELGKYLIVYEGALIEIDILIDQNTLNSEPADQLSSRISTIALTAAYRATHPDDPTVQVTQQNYLTFQKIQPTPTLSPL